MQATRRGEVILSPARLASADLPKHFAESCVVERQGRRTGGLAGCVRQGELGSMLENGYSIPPGLAGVSEEDLFGTMWLVGPQFEVDGRADEYSHVWEWEELTDAVWSADGYSVHGLVGFEPPCMVLARGGQRIGFYMGGQSWIDPEHRGRGLGAAMAVAATAFSGRLPDVRDIGFSEAGYRLHLRALEMIRELAAEATPSASVP